MLFRRLFRRRRPPPPVLLPSLERLAELIERVVELLDEVALGPPREPARPATPVPVPVPGNPAPSAVPSPEPPMQDGHMLLVSSPDGYRLLEREGAPPARGDLLAVDDVRFSVLRLGPSPLPADRRRCAYLQREEPPKVDRTFER
jgi:hypothetical protein